MATVDPLASLHLPAAFETVHLATCDSALAEAVRRARAGAPEGALVWADDQTAARGRLDAAWSSPRGGLHCAVVLRPDLSPARLGEFVPLGALALGAAIGALVVPLTELRYRWPNAVLLGDGRVGGVWLATDRDWMVLGASANVVETEDFANLRHACVRTDGGSAGATPAMLLEAYAYQLASWLGRWDDEGFAPVLQQFRSREERRRETMTVCLLDGSHITGRQAGIGDDGALLIDGGHGQLRVTINEYMGLPSA